MFSGKFLVVSISELNTDSSLLLISSHSRLFFSEFFCPFDFRRLDRLGNELFLLVSVKAAISRFKLTFFKITDFDSPEILRQIIFRIKKSKSEQITTLLYL